MSLSFREQTAVALLDEVEAMALEMIENRGICDITIDYNQGLYKFRLKLERPEKD